MHSPSSAPAKETGHDNSQETLPATGPTLLVVRSGSSFSTLGQDSIQVVVDECECGCECACECLSVNMNVSV